MKEEVIYTKMKFTGRGMYKQVFKFDSEKERALLRHAFDDYETLLDTECELQGTPEGEYPKNVIRIDAKKNKNFIRVDEPTIAPAVWSVGTGELSKEDEDFYGARTHYMKIPGVSGEYLFWGNYDEKAKVFTVNECYWEGIKC